MSPEIAVSVRERLLNQARARREEFERTLVRYADERLLYRIGASPARERCVVKGASLLAAWMSDPYRATRDVDLLAYGAPDEAAIRALVAEICSVACPEDGLRFDLQGLVVEDITATDEYVGKRARFFAYLGAARIRVQIDFGFGDALPGGACEIEYPTMLKTTPPPRVRGYSREASVAEKFEAMVSLDVRNSRMKDFHDLWALSDTFEFAGRALQVAVAACFDRRGTAWLAEMPRAITPAFYQRKEFDRRWRAYLEAGAVIASPPAQFEVIGERVIHFMGPVRDSIVAQRPLTDVWVPGGPWRDRSEHHEAEL